MTVQALFAATNGPRIVSRLAIVASSGLAGSRAAHNVVKVGIQTGAGTVSWHWTFDGATKRLAEGEVRTLSSGTTALPADALVVFELRRVGAAPSLAGVSLVLEVMPAKNVPLPRARGEDVQLVNAIQGALQHVGAGRETIVRRLADPAAEELSATAARSRVFEGRIQRDHGAQISLQRYTGDLAMVGGTCVTIPEAGITCSTSNSVIDASGRETGSAPVLNGNYRAYLSASGFLRLSTTDPSMTAGGLYLGGGTANRWRYVGWVRLNGSTSFVDNTTDRLVVNYYNRRPLALQVAPGYADDSAATTFTTTSTTFTPASGGTASYLSHGEDAVLFTAFSTCRVSAGNAVYIGIGDNSVTDASVVSECDSTVDFSVSCHLATLPAAGYRTASLLVRVTGGTGTFNADDARGGSAADPVATALCALVMG